MASAPTGLDGRALAGVEEEDRHRILEVMEPGDFFGEIAVITGMPRTADVVLDEDSTLLEVPVDVVRSTMNDPELYRIFVSQASTRLDRSHLLDNPRFCLLDQIEYRNRTILLSVSSASRPFVLSILKFSRIG